MLLRFLLRVLRVLFFGGRGWRVSRLSVVEVLAVQDCYGLKSLGFRVLGALGVLGFRVFLAC